MLSTPNSLTSTVPLGAETVLHRIPELVVHSTRAGYTVLRTAADVTAQTFFDINHPGKMLLALIDGRRSVTRIVSDYCAEAGIEATENQSWIVEYLTQIVARGIVFPGQASDDAPLIEIGDGSLLRPAHLTVEVTDTCNLECGHCYLEASPRKRAAISYADFEAVVRTFKSEHGLSIELTGGEFFLHPDAMRILELALREFSLVGLLTNGTVLPDEALELLARNTDRVTVGVSLDSVRPELHDRLRGHRGAFKRTVENVRRMVARGVRVRLGAVIFDENMWELRELAQFAVDLEAALFGFNYVEGFGRGVGFDAAHGVRFDEKYKEYVASVLEEFNAIIPVLVGEQMKSTHTNCGAGTGSVVIDPDGNVRPCAIFPRTRAFGNVLQSRWDEVFDSPDYRILSAVPDPRPDNGCPVTCPDFGTCYGCYLKGLRRNADRPDEPCRWVTTNNLSSVVEAFRAATMVEVAG